jgi:hypothetical protein
LLIVIATVIVVVIEVIIIIIIIIIVVVVVLLLLDKFIPVGVIITISFKMFTHNQHTLCEQFYLTANSFDPRFRTSSHDERI